MARPGSNPGSSEFTKPVVEPLELPDCFATTEVKVHQEITGVIQLRKLLTVYSATREIADGSCASNILKCHQRSLTQKKNKCEEKCPKMIVSLPSHFSMRKLRKYLTSYVIKTHQTRLSSQKLTRQGCHHKNCKLHSSELNITFEINLKQ